MATIMYVIVPESAAKWLKLDAVRDQLANGCYLLRDKDLIGVEGGTLFERVSSLGGAIVNEGEAFLIKSGKIPVPIENDLERKDSLSEEKEKLEESPQVSDETINKEEGE